jgi:hypothetical protein
MKKNSKAIFVSIKNLVAEPCSISQTESHYSMYWVLSNYWWSKNLKKELKSIPKIMISFCNC